ncbi:FAD/NAD(P)-binding oxidoreductase [Gordonia sp. LSe1-13]|uniref:FAD/NAD(P)-binding oxidoreductase n=1 Tax=Gordonia sesuvii TaxID=3116777 RepID=A0ABU7M984_9ACTN|nr:FAD/NAD(P)-binding oxidoreductase [Gordonia sp. LSe1-13]
MKSVVIVGASAAGLSTAEALRREGFTGRIALVDSDDHMPYDRPPLSKQYLLGAWPAEKLALRSESAIGALEADLYLGRTARSLRLDSRTVVLDDGVELPFDDLVIATGVRPYLPENIAAKRVHTLRTLDDASRLRTALSSASRVAIVGAGFVGCEVAATCVSQGLDVELIDRSEAPLVGAIGTSLAHMITELHRSHGVCLHSGVGVLGIDDVHGGPSELALTDGSSVEADVVIVGVGSVPNTEWLFGTGIGLGNGIECDAYSQAAPRVWGVGDVASWVSARLARRVRVEHRLHAVEHAQHVARSIAHSRSTPFDPLPYFWSDQYDLRLQSFGHRAPAADLEVVAGSLDARKFVARYVSEGVIVGVIGANMPKETRLASREIGSPAELVTSSV